MIPYLIGAGLLATGVGLGLFIGALHYERRIAATHEHASAQDIAKAFAAGALHVHEKRANVIDLRCGGSLRALGDG